MAACALWFCACVRAFHRCLSNPARPAPETTAQYLGQVSRHFVVSSGRACHWHNFCATYMCDRCVRALIASKCARVLLPYCARSIVFCSFHIRIIRAVRPDDRESPVRRLAPKKIGVQNYHICKKAYYHTPTTTAELLYRWTGLLITTQTPINVRMRTRDGGTPTTHQGVAQG